MVGTLALLDDSTLDFKALFRIIQDSWFDFGDSSVSPLAWL